MVIDENKIRERIKYLEDKLQENADLYPVLDDAFLKRRLTQQSFNIESQLYALHYVLGEDYEYKYM